VPEAEVDSPTRPSRARKPTKYAQDILSGKGSATGIASRPRYPAGLQVPSEDDAANVVVANADDEADSAMVAALANAEGIEPQSLEEAKRQPDWPQW
jgi:hypothetical protein